MPSKHSVAMRSDVAGVGGGRGATAKVALATAKSDTRQQLTRNQTIRQANRELSCVNTKKNEVTRVSAAAAAAGASAIGPVAAESPPQDELAAGHELAEHLRSIAPFNKRWQVTKTINEGRESPSRLITHRLLFPGTYGVVFAVRDVHTGIDGVIKVAKSFSSGNTTTEWEGFLLERIFNNMPSASIVRVLDKGMLADQHGQGMEFIVLERAEVSVKDWLDDAKDTRERRLRVGKIALQMLKGITDLHVLGLLHRDLKPDNMGLCSKSQPIVMLFDLGMARMYTDNEGLVRPPRTVVPFRGTPEWASGHASKGREQTRFDDLIAWLYVTVELFERPESNQPLPWTYRTNMKAVALLKSTHAPARVLLRNCPAAFFAINTYLQTADRSLPPDYGYIADRMRDALTELGGEANEPITPHHQQQAVGAPTSAVTDVSAARLESAASNLRSDAHLNQLANAANAGSTPLPQPGGN